MRKIVFTLCLVAAFGVAPAVWADIVANGDFDANSPPGGTAPADWTLTQAISGSDFFVGAGPAYGALSPPNSANFGATGNYDDTLSQVLSTVAGQSYTLVYWLAHVDTDSENDFSVSWGGVTIPGSVLDNTASFGYTEFAFGVTATSSSTTLAFSGREVPSWYDLDDVSVNVGAVPEPAYLAVLPVAFVALLFARKRRQAQV